MTGHREISGVGERRRHIRYRIKEETFAFLGVETGTLVDISRGGLCVQCAVLANDAVLPAHLDLFVAKPHFYLPSLPFTLIGETLTIPASLFSSLSIKRFSLEFGMLSDEQRNEIDRFITGNTVGEH